MLSLLTISVLFTLFSQVLLQDKPYDFRPESRHIDINKGDDYYIGFDEIGNQTIFAHCSIKSDKYSIDYTIEQPTRKKNAVQVRSDSSSRFSPFNGTGVCGFIYYTVDDTVPENWIITAHDSKAQKDFTEQVSVKLYYNMPVYLQRIEALETATVVNFFDAGSTKLITCSLKFDNITIDLDLHEIKVYNNDIFKSRLASLGDGKCGYKINSVNSNDTRDLTLYATDDENKQYRNTTQFIVIVNKFLKNRTIEVYLGDTASVICGKETDTSANSDQKFCHLYNPQGVLVSHDHMCDYDLDIVTMDDLGTWKCLIGFDYIMDTLEFTTELREMKTEHMTIFINETNNYYVIGCELASFDIYTLEFCKFTRPDGKIFKVTTGGASTYYNTFTTDLANGICSLEILKPLRQEDKGSWKCEAALPANDMSGAFINVITSTTFPYDKYKKKNIELGNSFVIDCMVPYASDYCYVIAPNKTQYKPDSRLQITTGLCKFTVDEATTTDNGTWQCSIAQSNGVPDEIILVDISIIELKVLYADVEAAENKEVELICNTNGIPIEYCRFVSPSGLSYSLRRDNSISKKISYNGRGLEYGDCGMNISKVELSDQGEWTCHISSGRYNYRNKADITKKITLNINAPPSSPVSTAESVGIALGVVAVVIIIGSFAFYKYSGRCCRRHTQATSQYVSRGSNESEDRESVILEITSNPTYNTALNNN